jgi:hypothetical protein
MVEDLRIRANGQPEPRLARSEAEIDLFPVKEE